MPSGTVTLMFTDIEGSTELWDRLRGDFEPVLQAHDAIMREAIGAHDGVVVKTEGDAFMVVFHRATDAVRAAIQAQRELAAHEWPADVGELRVRMGLHTGAPVMRDQDYFGPPVNLAARVSAAGHGQQVLVSGVTAHLLEEGGLESLELRDLGLHRLKGLSEPVELFQVCHPDLPRVAFPAVRTLDHRPHNLPRILTSFVGRERELREVGELLDHEDARVVTLSGPGGTGKTRLALEVAGRQLDRFPDGVWFVDLSAVRDSAHLITEIGTSLGLRFQPTEPPLDQLQHYFERRRALLVLDNFEQVTEAADVVSDLLRKSDELRCLVTSRERLRVRGEHEYRVPPLSVPPDTDALETLSQSEGVQLFVERAHQADPNFQLNAETARPVAQICRRVDGIPLAVELAAARIRSMTPAEVFSRLEKSFDILGSRDRDVPDRQRTLRNVLDWSHELLSPEEQETFAALAVFPGGCYLQAAEEVLDDFGVIDLLESLSEKSLLRIEPVLDRSRYLLFPVATQEYAERRLPDLPAEADIRERHGAYYLQHVEARKEMLTGAKQEEAVAELQVEMDNLRAGHKWVASRGDGQAAARYAVATSRLMRLLGLWEERRAWAKEARALLGEDAPLELLGDLLHTLALAHHDLCDYDQASATYEESLAIRRELGDQRGMAASLNNMGIIAWARGRYAEARERYQRGLAIQRELNDLRGVAVALNNLGSVACTLGDYEEAEKLYQESLQIHRDLQDPWGIAGALNNLGDLVGRCGAYEQARQYHQESLSLRQSVGDQSGVAASLNNLAEMARQLGDLDQARQLCEDGLRIRRELRDQRGIAISLSTLGNIECACGRHEEARAHLRESLTLAHALGERKTVAGELWDVALLGRAAGMKSQAVELLAAARTQLAGVGVTRGYEVSEVERELGELEADLGKDEFAAAKTRGEAMSLDEAVQYALREVLA